MSGECAGVLRRLQLTLPISVRGMGPLVRRNVALLGEAPWAHGASVRLLPRVGPLMWRNVALC